jgi:hypothetical protein
VSHLDQTKFKTLQYGVDVAKEFQLNGDERRIKGESFTLTLLVDIPFSPNPDEKKELPIIVDRRSIGGDGDTIGLANDGLIAVTTARLDLDGPAFVVNILFLELDKMTNTGADVLVSKDMERIILAKLEEDANRLLRGELDA